MTPRATTDIDRITRCALCKVDLKGRFVFIDDLTETLLGHTKEELFGKQFREFLAETDHELFFHVMRQQRTYETAYDSMPVTLVNRSGHHISATLIVTLGYIAGNPVNYQIIIQTDEATRITVASIDESPAYHRFLSTVLAMNGSLSLADVAEPMREFMGAMSIVVHHMTGGKLETIAAAPREAGTQAPLEIHRLPGLLEALAKVSSEPGLSPDLVQRGIVERSTGAPHEYFAKFQIDDSVYLIRVHFAPEDEGTQEVIAQKTTLALQLVCRLLKSHAPVGDVVIAEHECGPVLALFDTIGLGGLFVRPDGSIASANHAFVRWCNGTRPGGNIRDLVVRFGEWGGHEVVKNLTNFFDAAVAQPPLSWHETVRFPGGKTARVTVVRHSASQSDFSAWLIIHPVFNHNGSGKSPIDSDIVEGAIKDILSSVSSATVVADRLTHEFYDELHRDGNLYLSLLNGHMDKLHGMVSELGHLMRVWLEVEEPGACDLNLIVAGVVQELSSIYPETVVNCRFSNLPKIHSLRRRLTYAVKNILSNAVKYAQAGKVDIQISAQTTQHACQISISDSGPGIPKKYQDKIFSLYYRVPIHPWQKIPGDGSSLAITRELVRALGGKLTLSSEEGQGTKVALDIPILADALCKPARPIPVKSA